jgi:hypothetical protein
MKSVNIFLGVKAEQTLRDAVRAAAEAQTGEGVAIELCPVGKKDWIAGERISRGILFGDLNQIAKQVLKRLIGLGSYQRIKSDSLKIWAVRKPVPVFKDPPPMDSDRIADKAPHADKDVITCPVCGSPVNSYNIQYNPSGKMVGCYLCRGEQPNRKG